MEMKGYGDFRLSFCIISSQGLRGEPIHMSFKSIQTWFQFSMIKMMSLWDWLHSRDWHRSLNLKQLGQSDKRIEHCKK